MTSLSYFQELLGMIDCDPYAWRSEDFRNSFLEAARTLAEDLERGRQHEVRVYDKTSQTLMVNVELFALHVRESGGGLKQDG